jgi:NAD-dependent dihydropyrimidine dehydrogenase PreA subunit
MMDSCPYGVVYWNDQKAPSNGVGLPQKCTFCAHLLDDHYEQPRCAESCPVNAIAFGDMDDPESEVSTLVRSGRTETLRPELGIDTAVRYIGLPKPIIGGSVVLGDSGECGTEVDVTIAGGNGELIQTRTNNYGDFLIEGLRKGETYKIALTRPGYAQKILSVALSGDSSLGEILLTKQ